MNYIWIEDPDAFTDFLCKQVVNGGVRPWAKRTVLKWGSGSTWKHRTVITCFGGLKCYWPWVNPVKSPLLITC